MTANSEWAGWSTLSEEPLGQKWAEASHVLSADLPYPSYFPAPEIARLLTLPQDALNLTRVAFVCHYGTHVDAPSHLIAGAPTMEEVPLDRFSGPGVVWGLDIEPDTDIDSGVLESATPTAQPGDIALLSTGWSQYVGTPVYDHHPSLTEDAATWLVERQIKLLGVDFVTPDLPILRREAGFDFPVHRVLLSAGVLIAENLTNLRSFEGHRVEVLMLPLRIAGSDGSPVRVLIRDDGPVQ